MKKNDVILMLIFLIIFPVCSGCIASEISSDGRHIAALEAPARLDDGTVLGKYKVHILT